MTPLLPVYTEGRGRRASHADWALAWLAGVTEYRTLGRRPPKLLPAYRRMPRRTLVIAAVYCTLMGLLVVNVLARRFNPSQTAMPHRHSGTTTDTPHRAEREERHKGSEEVHSAPSELYFPASHLTNLVLVAGHAVYNGHSYTDALTEGSWFLEDHQKVAGAAKSFVGHIQLGVKEAGRDPKALLLFSGGQTRQYAGPRSEALSYWLVAQSADWFKSDTVRERTFLEEHARDSFENLLFSLCRFYELTGHYPHNVTVISYELKQRRFEDLHRHAVRFPKERFHFVGTEVPNSNEEAREGEASTVASFVKYPYGCEGILLEKRQRRDPFAVGIPHYSRCPEMKDLLLYCGRILYNGAVPWM